MAVSTYLDFEKPVADLEKRIAELEATAAADALVVHDIPLLAESGRWARQLDAVVVVDAGATGSIPYPSLTKNLHHEVEAVLDFYFYQCSLTMSCADLARGFGFSGFTLREVAVNANEPGFARPRMMAMEARASAAPADAPLPVEPGKSTVVVTVSGSVQMK